MKILITGSTGYIGKRLMPLLLNEGHTVVCSVRDTSRTIKHNEDEYIEVVEADFLKPDTLVNIPKDIDAAYYLIHSMSNSSTEFHALEEKCAQNFKNFIEKTSAKQVIYLSGITNDTKLSKHLLSRKNVENILQSNTYALTTFKAGIIVGSGSSSFEIIRDLVEKLPVMIAPKWLKTKTQPIAIRDVLKFLLRAMGNEKLYNKSFDIFGPEILTYQEMLLGFAKIRGLKLSKQVKAEAKKTVSKKITKAKRMIRTSEDNVELIKKLGELKKAGIISNKEFQAKKKQLLDRI